MSRRVSGAREERRERSRTTGRAGADLTVPLVDDAILRGYLREHLGVAAGLAVAALVPAVVLVGSLRTLRRVEARSMPVSGIVVEQLPAAPDGWERLHVTYAAPDEEADAAVAVADADAYRVGQRVDLLVDSGPPVEAVLASELPEPSLASIATSLALAASVAIAVRSTRWVRRLRRLVHQPSPQEGTCEAAMSARLCESRRGVTLQLSEADVSPPGSVVVFPLMASQQELVDRDRPFPVSLRWDPRDPEVMVASIGGRVLWPRRRARRECQAALAGDEGASSAGRGCARGSDGDQAGCMPDRPASTTNDARVTTGAPGRET